MKEKMTNRKIQAQETRNKIINVVWQLLQTKTLEEVTVTKICESANISIGAFYHHFKTKEDVVFAAFKQFDDLIKETLIHKQYSTTIEAIIDLLYHEVIGAKDHGISITTEILKLTLKKQTNNVFSDETRFFHIYLKQLIIKAQKEGLIKETTDVDSLGELLLRHTRGIGYDWVAHQGSYDLEATIKNDIQLLLNNFIVTKKTCKLTKAN